MSEKEAIDYVCPGYSLTAPLLSGVAQEYLLTYRQLAAKRTYQFLIGAEEVKTVPNAITYAEYLAYSQLTQQEFTAQDIDMLNYLDVLDMQSQMQ